MIKTDNLQNFLKEIEKNVSTDKEYCFQKCAYIYRHYYISNVTTCLLFNKKIRMSIDDDKFNRCPECLAYIGE